ncbi:MAG: 16S rRNA (guanine(966)-N(2))-methyltransferase RsmD [Candidatus Omnitrophica bacterium]|nr:16S rRNA (guanine(966)-N(2))-methyltransferase RsmD [Candidatus Omnitrophota bacterium]
MRIISGKYKGRAIKAPLHIRPTQDKVRKALFDILGDIQGLSFLELFAGSGAVGLEALSRGASESVLVENNRDALKAIEKNIAFLKIGFYQVWPLEADEAIKRFHKQKKKFDIIFLDPPYYKGFSKKTLQMLRVYDILAPYGLIIAQHFKKESLPEAEGDLTLFRQSCYGDTVLSFYKK